MFKVRKQDSLNECIEGIIKGCSISGSVKDIDYVYVLKSADGVAKGFYNYDVTKGMLVDFMDEGLYKQVGINRMLANIKERKWKPYTINKEVKKGLSDEDVSVLKGLLGNETSATTSENKTIDPTRVGPTFLKLLKKAIK